MDFFFSCERKPHLKYFIFVYSRVNEIILFLYAAMDENSSGYKLRPVFGGSDAQKLTGIVGKTVGLGEFNMDFVTGNGNENQAHHTFHSLIDR